MWARCTCTCSITLHECVLALLCMLSRPSCCTHDAEKFRWQFCIFNLDFLLRLICSVKYQCGEYTHTHVLTRLRALLSGWGGVIIHACGRQYSCGMHIKRLYKLVQSSRLQNIFLTKSLDRASNFSWTTKASQLRYFGRQPS